MAGAVHVSTSQIHTLEADIRELRAALNESN
jgi:hypothetical protein